LNLCIAEQILINCRELATVGGAA